LLFEILACDEFWNYLFRLASAVNFSAFRVGPSFGTHAYLTRAKPG